MMLELLTVRGNEQLTHRNPRLCSIGEAVAELMARYELVVDGPAEADGGRAADGGAADEEFALAGCL